MNMEVIMFRQRQLKEKIALYEYENTIHRRQIEDIEKRLTKEDAPKAALERNKKALEKQIEYANIQIKRLKRQCL